MAVSFDHGTDVAEVVRRTEALVRDVVLPAEAEHRGSAHDAPDDLRRHLQDAAREADVFSSHVGTQ
ncbi:hypothetical protein GCM10027258_23920 [Amycolatopsis stemonae]